MMTYEELSRNCARYAQIKANEALANLPDNVSDDEIEVYYYEVYEVAYDDRFVQLCEELTQ